MYANINFQSFVIQDYEEMVLVKYRKLRMLTEKGIDKFPENITLNHLKVHLDTIFDDENEYDNKEKENDNVEGSNEDDEEYNDGIEGGQNVEVSQDDEVGVNNEKLCDDDVWKGGKSVDDMIINFF